MTSFKKIRDYDKSALALWFKTDKNEYYITSETLKQNKTILDFNKIKNLWELPLCDRPVGWSSIKKRFKQHGEEVKK